MHTPFLPSAGQRAAGVPPAVIASIHPNRIAPVPITEWPLWARAVAKIRRPTDMGLGDTVVHLIGNTRSEKFRKWFHRKFGRTCGCTERQRWLNQKYPYK
ncbi:MAG TPA: hypothetical protein VN873_02440 [Candidatus Angelobacter sp.]|nr:hypothetical protein [Candidatus Angelobacter sp.]